MSAREGAAGLLGFAGTVEIFHGPSKAKFRRMVVIWLGGFFFLWAVGAHASTETKTFVAFSMRAAEGKIETAIKDGVDFRRKQPELYQLGGITKPWAIIIDPEHSDWILVGERDVNSSIVTLDDLAVALRARFFHADADPGVTIDPQAGDPSIKLGDPRLFKMATSQKVRFFAGVQKTHFGEICYEADWLMKRVGLGIENLQIDHLETYWDLLRRERTLSHATSFAASRFWFYPIVNRVDVLGDVVLLEKFRMGVFTEILYMESKGRPITDASASELASDGFARSFSDNYDAAAKAREVLETLRELTRLAGLAKGLVQAENKPNLSFWLQRYPVASVETPETVDVLRVEDRSQQLEVRGGVELAALAARLRDGDATALKQLVLKTRPSPNPVSWRFDVAIRDGRPVGVTMPDSLSDPDQVAAAVDHAWFLYQKKDYKDSLEALDAAFGRAPELAAEGYWAKAVVMREYGLATAVNADATLGLGEARLREAIALFQKSTQANPNFASAYFELGVTFGALSDHAQAIAALEKAVALDGTYAPAHFKLGVEYAQTGKPDLAKREFETFMAQDPSGDLADEVRARLKAIARSQTELSGFVAPKPDRHYTDKTLGLAFDYPADWVVLTRGEVAAKSKGIISESNPTLVLALGNPNDWDQNVTIQIVHPGQRTLSDVDLNGLADTMGRRMPALYPDLKEMSRTIIRIQGAPTLRYAMSSSRMNERMESVEYVISTPGTAYIVILTAKESEFRKIDDNYFQTIIRDFRRID